MTATRLNPEYADKAAFDSLNGSIGSSDTIFRVRRRTGYGSSNVMDAAKQVLSSISDDSKYVVEVGIFMNYGNRGYMAYTYPKENGTLKYGAIIVYDFVGTAALGELNNGSWTVKNL